jgi:hypothetical protein
VKSITAFGLREIAFGLREIAFGLREIAFGLRTTGGQPSMRSAYQFIPANERGLRKMGSFTQVSTICLDRELT